MRTLSATLQAAQTALTVTPYVKFKLTSADGGTTYDYSNRILKLEHHEEPYNEYATVVLDNHDRTIASDLRGYWVQIAYGYITGVSVADVEGAESAGNMSTAEYSYTPRLWVKNQQELSSPGNVKVILELEGMWAMLKEMQYVSSGAGTALFHKDYPENTTTYTIISQLLAMAGLTLDAIGDQSDGNIDVVQPSFSINAEETIGNVFDGWDILATIIYRALVLTKCYLRSKTGLAFKVVYPQTTDTVKETYYSNQQYIFKEYLERKKLLIPNHIKVLWGGYGIPEWSGWLWVSGNNPGEASDATEIAKYKDITAIELASELLTVGEANTRASTILTRTKAELFSGRLIIRHDCSVELYDRIAIYDTRGY
jgi:hypothetical protein